MKFTLTEKAREARREVAMRREVYGRNAPGGILPPEQQRRIEIMTEIAEEYEANAARDEPQLF